MFLTTGIERRDFSVVRFAESKIGTGLPVFAVLVGLTQNAAPAVQAHGTVAQSGLQLLDAFDTFDPVGAITAPLEAMTEAIGTQKLRVAVPLEFALPSNCRTGYQWAVRVGIRPILCVAVYGIVRTRLFNQVVGCRVGSVVGRVGIIDGVVAAGTQQ